MGILLDAAYGSVLAAATPWMLWRSIRTGRYRSGWNERLWGAVPETPADQASIWLHGVSLGEVQLLIPLARRLQELYATHRIVLSTSTLTGMKVAKEQLPAEDVFTFPWDFSWAMKRAFQRLRPELVVLGELEVWPHLVATARHHRVPVAVVNARLSEKSFRGYSRVRRLLRPTFASLSLVAAQNDATADRFRHLGAPGDRILTTGSLKFDNVSSDRFHPRIAAFKNLVGIQPHHRVIVGGSTQDPEEEVLVRAWLDQRDRYPDAKLIVIPRHPERFEEVFRNLQAFGQRIVRRSELTEPVVADEWDVLLVDTVGELRWWWGLAEIALVGGSFGDRGGQNMLEPAGYGANVAFGPNTWNFREIVRGLLEHDAATQLKDLQQVSLWLADQLADPLPGQLKGQRAKQMIEQQQGATDRTLQQLIQFVPQQECDRPRTPLAAA